MEPTAFRAAMIDWEEFYASFRKPGFVAGYEIQNRLGGGAFGEVYKARKLSIGKPYAIKFLKLDDQTSREAIERELDQVRHFAQIDHPNLVTIEDMGVVLGVPYLIMGYAGEDTLARRIKREPLEPERALAYFVQCARGVLALHDRRLVHFDLKPSNVFLKGEVARVGDYGLAKLMTDGRSTLSFGRGTPHYMAPEMLRNRADHRADVYSLGVILYESIAGSLPFDADPAAGFIVREEDLPPSFPAHFPIGLRPAVERCLRLDPAQRFDDVNELLAALSQTGRQGDSIALPKELIEASAPRPRERPSSATLAARAAELASPPAPPAAAAFMPAPPNVPAPPGRMPTPTPVSARSAARETASELARGAAQVALGVWDGLRSARGEARPGDARSLGATPLESGAPLVAQLPAATVPVPPRIGGGFFATAMTSFTLGIEVFAALVFAPVRRIVLGVGRAGRGFVGRARTWVGATLRLLALLFALVLLGSSIALFAVLLYRFGVR
jgi:serine/threonine-protein kinase